MKEAPPQSDADAPVPSNHPAEGLTLTARQKEILQLVAQGHTNREIGEQLEISVRTVEVHRFNLMRRLNVKNVAQLLRQSLLLRLIPNGVIPKKPNL